MMKALRKLYPASALADEIEAAAKHCWKRASMTLQRPPST
jgi:hypothetical protein